MQSRYYNPEMGRFINADSYASTGQGVLGYNMYAYCVNNPVCRVDFFGCKPMSLFTSVDEVAQDFANYINEASITENLEYSSFVYRKIVVEQEKYQFAIPNWLQNIVGQSSVSIPWFKLESKYYYKEPTKGTIDTVDSSPWGLLGSKAILHTHGAYTSGYSSDIFSDGDKTVANKLGIPIYVATPIGTLRKYDPSTGYDTIISIEIPYDPQPPDR